MASITVQFHGIWRLYLGTDKAALEAISVDQALAQVVEKFGPRFKQRLQERGAKFDGDILKYSYIVLNKTNIKELKDRNLKEGDVLHLFLAVPGG